MAEHRSAWRGAFQRVVAPLLLAVLLTLIALRPRLLAPVADA